MSTVIPNPIDHDHNDHNHKSDDSNTTTDYHKFGESVYVGDKNLYVAALNYDNGKGKVFVYPFQDNFAKTDVNAWTDPQELQPNDVLENSHFGYRFSEIDNEISISTFNQKTIYNYSLNSSESFELSGKISSDTQDNYFGRSILMTDEFLLAGDYYADQFHVYNNSKNNRILNNSFSTASQIVSIRDKIECVNGLAGQFECNEIDLMSFMDKTEIGGSNSTSLNDIWGWTDPQTNKEYALVGMSNGTSFVDISNPENPIYLGRLPTQTNNSTLSLIHI